jgi:hypothetical protein
MPTARARPPSDITLIVSPSADDTAMANNAASGIETHTISVLRQLPRKIRIISAVRIAAVIASWATSRIDARTMTDWSKIGVSVNAGGRPALIFGIAALTSSTMVRVEAAPFLTTVRSAEAWPFSLT